MKVAHSKLTTITILGSTGSIGESTLDVVRQQPQYRIFALTAFNNVQKLAAQCLEFNPKYAVLVNETAAEELAGLLVNTEVTVLSGAAGLIKVAEHEEAAIVMAAIVGGAGLKPTLAAVEAGKKVLLANKESLVMAGELFMQSVSRHAAQLLPIDSEHNAIFQCLPVAGSINGKVDLTRVKRVILTASGGPFLNLPLSDFDNITPDQACNHPRWQMGRKISVDSATLMNKGLEFIEACFLFGLKPNQLEVLIHPQSIIHSMVEYIDGSVIAQLAAPDMRVPIAYGLAWPQRMESGASMLDLTKEQALEFAKPDIQRFPCLALGIEAAKMGGTAPTLLNGANEVAVQAFLEYRLAFKQIHRVIEAVMTKIPCEPALSLDIIHRADEESRALAKELIAKEKRH